ncbi:MAG: hypothetical protein ACOC8X_10145 [Chloroflexota bacterium]
MARYEPLPRLLQEKWGHLNFITFQGSGEWSAECPQCRDYGHVGNDDPDRFRMFQADGQSGERGWCRRCNFFAWADDPAGDGPSPEAIQAAKEERLRLAKQEMERQQQKIQAIEEAAFWRGWHEAMTDRQRRLWHTQGIPDYFIDYYKLGYVTHHTYYHDGQELISPAMTIPHYGDEWHLTNIQYRLTQPANGAGKYRQTAGLPAAMFRTEPEQELQGATMIVEGAKKGIVSYMHLGRAPLGFPLNIVAVPSKTPSGKMLEELADCEPIYIALDPDAYEPMRTRRGRQPSAAERVGEKLGDRVLYVQFPAKPDDLIVDYGLDGEDLKKYLKRATKTI